jgi:hypothetical protein
VARNQRQKDARLQRRGASDQRHATVKDAVAEVRELDLKDRDDISEALENAFRQRGLEFEPSALWGNLFSTESPTFGRSSEDHGDDE